LEVSNRCGLSSGQVNLIVQLQIHLNQIILYVERWQEFSHRKSYSQFAIVLLVASMAGAQTQRSERFRGRSGVRYTAGP
jgi:hypothetical protein